MWKYFTYEEGKFIEDDIHVCVCVAVKPEVNLHVSASTAYKYVITAAPIALHHMCAFTVSVFKKVKKKLNFIKLSL